MPPRRRGFAVGSQEDNWLDNDDLRPLKLADRTWTKWTYNIFWFSAIATVSNWYAASAAQALGLTMWESLGCSLGGQILIAFVIAANGRAGAVYHVGFPILNRSSFGVYGSWWPTFNRAAMAIVWNGVNAVQGGQCIYAMLHALTPRVTELHNIMGEGSALDTGGFIGFVIFVLICAAFLLVPIPKMRWLIYTKMAVYAVSAIAMLAWFLTLSRGSVYSPPSAVSGSAKAWLIVRFFFLGAANCATFASNAADFQRYTRKPNDVLLGNLVGFPLSNALVTIVGNVVGASTYTIFGELVWNPLTALDRIQTDSYTSGNRAGCCFIALCFTYCAVFSSIFENSIPAGNDIAALFPKWINVRRGMLLAQVITVAINPWYLLGSAAVFINFLSSYQIFLGAITGVLLCNYYLIARGYLLVGDLYTNDRQGAYYFTKGWNIRAYIAYVVGIIPNFYGFLDNMGVGIITPIGITRFYYFAYPVGLALSAGTFWLGNYLYPPRIKMEVWSEPGNYVRPEEDGNNVIEGVDEGSMEAVSYRGGAEKGVVMTDIKNVWRDWRPCCH